jgi:8-oxo-dGTP diphosphatase
VSPSAQPKPHIHVACGALRDADGRVLIVERPAGKIAALKWEFPGGKIEPGETPHEALVRELQEEIGIVAQACRPLILFTHEYKERIVTLHTWLITGWDGELDAREGQRFSWQAPDAPRTLDVLPTVDPILRALQLPEDYVFTPPAADADRIRAGIPKLPHRALLRLRLPGLDAAAYEALAASLRESVAAAGLRLVLDRDEAMARRVGAAGLHYSQARLASAPSSRDSAESAPLLRFASCHDVASLRHAERVGIDGVVLGSVSPTATHPGGAILGWEGFAALAAQSNLPAYAIGGVTPADKARAFASYAQGVAGISAYWSRSGS